MAISVYYTGAIPTRPIAIDVRDESGNPVNLTTYSSITPVMVGSDNEELDLTGAVVNTGGAATGRLVFRWPTDRSLFTKHGEYLLQLQLDSGTGRDFTTVHTIRVKKLGGTY